MTSDLSLQIHTRPTCYFRHFPLIGRCSTNGILISSSTPWRIPHEPSPLWCVASARSVSCSQQYTHSNPGSTGSRLDQDSSPQRDGRHRRDSLESRCRHSWRCATPLDAANVVASAGAVARDGGAAAVGAPAGVEASAFGVRVANAEWTTMGRHRHYSPTCPFAAHDSRSASAAGRAARRMNARMLVCCGEVR
jgi:hypothetical protein